MHRRTLLAQAGAGAAIAASGRVSAYRNSKPLRIAIGFPAGFVTDNIARTLAQELRSVYHSGVLIENKVGAGGRIAVDYVKREEDDHTILLTPGSMMCLYPHVFKTLGYAPLLDFKSVSGVASMDYAIAVGPAVDSSVKNLADYVRWCKGDSSRAIYGVPAAGSTPHFIGTLLAREANLLLTVIPYKGGEPIMRDLIGGTLPMAIDPLPNAVPLHEAGKLRILATTGERRSRSLPGVQSVVDAQFPDLVVTEWYGMYAPASVSAARVLQLQYEIVDAVKASEEHFAKMLVTAHVLSAQELESKTRSETERWRVIVEKSGFRP